MLAVDGSEEEHVDQHGALQQRLQCPLVWIKVVHMLSPSEHALSEQCGDSLSPCVVQRRTGDNQPLARCVSRYLEEVHLCHNEDDESRKHSRQEKTGYTAESGFGDGDECSLNVSSLGHADWLQSADVASHQCEDGDTDTALEEDANDRPLQWSANSIWVLMWWLCVWVKELWIESATQMGNNDRNRGETSQAL